MVNVKLNEKSIKDLEFMAKKLKKRISILEKIDPSSHPDVSNQIAILVDAYRRLKIEIIDISNKTN